MFFNLLTRRQMQDCRKRDHVTERIEEVRYQSSRFLEAHVRANGLHKINKEAVRNAMLYAHSLEESLVTYERELRAKAEREALAKTTVQPLPDLETTDE